MIISTDKTLQSGWIKGERPTHERLIKGALNFASHFIFNVVDYGIQIARVSVVRPFVGTRQIAWKSGWVMNGTFKFANLNGLSGNPFSIYLISYKKWRD